jgi:hypothetical protein
MTFKEFVKKLFSLFPLLNQVRCRRLFKSLEPLVLERCEGLNVGDPNGTCECVSVSRYSKKGRVTDEEYLFRFIFDPKDVIDGKVVSTHFDDVSMCGLSTNRADTDEVTGDLRARGEQLAATRKTKPGEPPNSLFCVFPARCMEIRKLTTPNGSRSFRIFDTAKKENPDHADVFQWKASQARAERKKQRKRLRDLFIPKELQGE